jgi:HD-GYP domain-containing protein (c-di-GMP phosphodiesterase class II)
MPTKVIAYVVAMTVAAVLASGSVYALGADFDQVQLLGAAGLTILGAYAAASKYKVSRGSHGEVSFIPFLTAIVIAPGWPTLAMLFFAVALAEVPKNKDTVKKVFNVAQTILALACAVAAYRLSGGVSLVADNEFRFVPHVLAVGTFLVVNAAAVSGVLSLVESKSFLRVFVQNNASSFAYDLFSIPGVYFVARAYTDWSWWGVGLTVFLLYGVRLTYQARVQLENTNRELLELFVHTVEFRDPYTSGHSQRVARFSRTIARAIGLSTKEVQRIGRAALLHDVGKIHEVFAPILSKPGKLTPEERALMELHPVKSAELVAKLSDFEDIVADVRHHHERFDGKGYPDRLEGKAIPLGSRIIAFADTIDAMTTDRKYRKGMTPDEVREEIIRCRGSQFDPDICDALINSPVFAQLFDGSDEVATLSITQVLGRVRRAKTPVPV